MYYSPMIQSIEVIKKGKVRRAKLYYLKDLYGKSTRIKERKQFDICIKNLTKY